jgi:ribosome-associated protein
METKIVLKKICEVVEEKKGDQLVILDVSQISSFTDYFLLCTGHNQRQSRAICDGIRDKLKKEDQMSPSHVEGYEVADWILMDYLSCIVHIFSPETRAFYKLERLWSDGVELEPKVISA